MKRFKSVKISDNHKSDRFLSTSKHRSLLRFIGLLVFISIWFFVLGILVGRQFISFDTLEKPQDAIHGEEVQEKLDGNADGMNPEEMKFYDELRKNEEPEFKIPHSRLQEGEILSDVENGQHDKGSTKMPNAIYYIQTLASKNLEATKRLVETLRNKGYKSSYEEFYSAGGNRMYRSKVGPFSGFQEANSALVSLKKISSGAFVIRER